MRKLYVTATLVALTTSLAACGSKVENLAVNDAVIYSPFPGQTTASAYLTIDGAQKGDRLLSISSPLSDRVEIHNHIKNGDVMKMVRVEGLDMTGKSVEFKPGGYHVMIFDAQINGVQSADLVLEFEKSGSITVQAPITDRSGTKTPKANGSGDKTKELTEAEKDIEYGSAH